VWNAEWNAPMRCRSCMLFRRASKRRTCSKGNSARL
jgi:hypothetical protein